MMFSWIARVIKGIVIAFRIYPTWNFWRCFAAILGIYERMISFLAHPFKDFKK